MKGIFRIFVESAILAATLAGQSSDPVGRQPGARLKLAPSEPLTEPRFPTPRAEKAKPQGVGGAAIPEQGIRPAILQLRPAGDPIYLVEEPQSDAGHKEWRTYSRPKVEQFSRDGDGIAAQGYDVVSYLGKQAEEGKKDLSVEYGGTTWLFATVEHRDLFIRNPERYLPAYGGFCAYSIAGGYPATADPRVFTINGGKLHLFFDRAVRVVWEQDQNRLIEKADKNWPKLHR